MIWRRLIGLSPGAGETLQHQIRRGMVAAIRGGRLPPGMAVPSPRLLAAELGVSRNTVALAYGQLVDGGALVVRDRQGHFVGSAMSQAAPCPDRDPARGIAPDWDRRFVLRPTRQRNIEKPRDWQGSRYPFLYGQFDATLFPIAAWRECCRLSMAVTEMYGWAPDLIDGDDPLLIEQLRSHLLPRRGVFARPDEIMVTIGAQHALFLLSALLVGPGSTVGIEDPGYPDARNIFALNAGPPRLLRVDPEGLVPDGALVGCDCVYVTPSHQCPTNATMPMARREALLRMASEHDFLVIEDDYETEIGLLADQTPALKSMDDAGRVIHVGSLSKTLAPGLRLGFIVAAPALIREARALRRLMLRHPPANNQRAVALFLERGHGDTLLRRIGAAMQARAAAMRGGLARHLPAFRLHGSAGGSSVWLEGPPGLDTHLLAAAAMRHGVLIEPGDIFFGGDGPPPRNFLRLGYAAIPVERIEPGLAALAVAVAETPLA